MTSGAMSPAQRVLVIVAGAFLLPAVVVVVLVFSQVSMGEVREIERQAQEAADLIVVLTDARAKADLTALRVLSQSPIFANGDIAASWARARTTLDLVPAWKAVSLSNFVTGEVAFQATRTDAASASIGVPLSSEKRTGDDFGGVVRDGALCPCVFLEAPVTNLADFVLTAVVDPHVYQEMLLERLPAGAVAALVDKSGNFVARSVDYEDRVGTLATQFVRNAVAKGGRGIYQGTTYEGLTNYTAYTTSSLTGWSAHVAVSDALFDGPRTKANTALIMGALAAILIGAALFTYVLRDIAARRMEDRRILESQKAEAMQQFTASVVHDFRNVASAVQSGLNMIARQTKEPATLNYVKMTSEVMDRGLRLTNRLLSFVRNEASETEDIGIAEFLNEISYLLEQAAGHLVQVRIEVPKTTATVRANRDQLELALVNLVGNARDAMDGEGSIQVRATVDMEEVQISVADKGPGIPPELRTQVLEPFFTTKPEGRGTGLGLAQVADMIREADGQVTIGEASGGGALITLHLKR